MHERPLRPQHMDYYWDLTLMVPSRFPTHFRFPTMLATRMTSRPNQLVSWHMALQMQRMDLCEIMFAARYQASMLRSLKEVQADDSVVGFYQATTLGAFFNQTLVDTQAIHQDKLRHGGIVIVHGTRWKAVYGMGCRLICNSNRSFANSAGECFFPRIPIDRCLLECI